MSFYALWVPTKSNSNAANALGGGSSSSPAATASGSSSTNSSSQVAEQNSSNSLVFRNKTDALVALKANKDSRLREFDNEEDALKYAETGYEEEVQQRYADPKNSSPIALEKAAYRAPTRQELTEFRKIIESGDYERVKAIIWDNPRYLVSSGDTPTTLKEGFRYNALHVCAVSKKPRIAELILKTVSDVKFVDLLTGKKNDEKMCKELCANLLDYYLNIPEKGRSETPLHLAAKLGSVEMVEVLTSFPECKMTPNNDGLLPQEIICARVTEKSPETYKKIAALLEERYYVPVLRTMDEAIPPQIGEPFSVNNPPQFNADPLSPEVKIQALAGPMSSEQAQLFRRRWKTPPRLGSNVSSPIANNPYISPKKVRGNITLHGSPSILDKLNCTPRPITATLERRNLFADDDDKVSTTTTTTTAAESMQFGGEIESSDKHNGNHDIVAETMDIDDGIDAPEIMVTNASLAIETNNNGFASVSDKKIDEATDLPQQSLLNKKPLFPKTPLFRFKQTAFFTYREQNVASPVLFDDLNCSKNNSNLNDSSFRFVGDRNESPGYKERHIKITDTEKGLEVIGRELAKESNVEWREYWDFLDAFIDISSTSGLRKLEDFLAKRIKEAEAVKKAAARPLVTNNNQIILEDVCDALEKLGLSRESTFNSRSALNNTIPGCRSEYQVYSSGSMTSTSSSAGQNPNPYTCVEKSLQVFAKRMTKTIIHNIENIVHINDTLLCELKRLKSLISSFKEDNRFLTVDFSKVHSRIGNLISIYLENTQEVNSSTKSKIINIFHNLQLTPGDRREHMDCVCLKILNQLESSGDRCQPESLKTEEMCSREWLKEKSCSCQWEINITRKTSRRNRMEARHKNPVQIIEQSKLAKEVDCATQNTNEFKNIQSSSNDVSDEEVFYSDVSDSDSENDVFYTPCESPSRLSLSEDSMEEDYKIFVYGAEPTKRDLDVLNAIFHLNLDSKLYPSINAWKTALLRFSSDEMDYFPSPSVVKKSSHSFVARKLYNSPNAARDWSPLQINKQKLMKIQTSTPQQSPTSSKQQQSQQKENNPQAQNQLNNQPATFFAKRLFTSPGRSKTVGSITTHNNLGAGDPIGSGGGVFGNVAPKTPLNKMRGLFSAYRDNHYENSPLSMTSSPAPSSFSERGKNMNSKNLSLLNISATK